MANGVLLKYGLRGLIANQLAPKGGRGSNPLHSVSGPLAQLVRATGLYYIIPYLVLLKNKGVM